MSPDLPTARGRVGRRRGGVHVAARFGLAILAIGWCVVGCGEAPPTSPAQQDNTGDSVSHDEPDPAVDADRRNPIMLIIEESVEPAPKPTEPLDEKVDCISAECHAQFATSSHVHAPVSKLECDNCHEPDVGGHRYPLIRKGNAGCVFCHSVAGRAEVQHEVVDQSGCTTCHDPHASQTNFLLKSPSVQALCISCHDQPMHRSAHVPYVDGQCTACHEPHESSAPGLLRGGAGVDHCTLCHEPLGLRMANAPFVHPPAEEDCQACHGPHSTEYSHLMRESIQDTCFNCHGDMREQVFEVRTSHEAVFTGDSCANCHDPHAAAGRHLLRSRADQLCLECHNRAIQTSEGDTIPDMTSTLERKYLHGPVRAGDCAACHNAHGSAHTALLHDTFPATFYANFDMRNYVLCFQCHNKELVLIEKTDQLTDFRDGSQNLHYAHVRPEGKGRTCKACHAIHGSDQPKHVADSVPFDGSQWAMPIGFEKTDGGGSCAPGCHEPRGYSRDPSDEPPPDPAQRGQP